jgi:hypothetical protein
MNHKKIYKYTKSNEWVVEKKTIAMQHWNFYWVAKCYALNVSFRGKTKKYVVEKIKEYEEN